MAYILFVLLVLFANVDIPSSAFSAMLGVCFLWALVNVIQSVVVAHRNDGEVTISAANVKIVNPSTDVPKLGYVFIFSALLVLFLCLGFAVPWYAMAIYVFFVVCGVIQFVSFLICYEGEDC